ncbi:hypothetical protein ACWGNE_11755 [Streptomyces xiamenensis]
MGTDTSFFDPRHPWRSSTGELDAAYWDAVQLHRLRRPPRAFLRIRRFRRRGPDIR